MNFFVWTAQISNKTSWLEEKDRKPDWQGVSGERQEQPSNIQLPGIVYFLKWCG